MWFSWTVDNNECVVKKRVEGRKRKKIYRIEKEKIYDGRKKGMKIEKKGS